jgi:hypothetical protein
MCADVTIEVRLNIPGAGRSRHSRYRRWTRQVLAYQSYQRLVNMLTDELSQPRRYPERA